ncbi:MAG: SDR family NAD(P)-dependent oxidoreductase [Gammaproteobacteria bacterium]|nr:MAG: SDR family NAD(P)-dependent oxidoreductase [Gammaproteobacteria bacterium]
MKTAVILGVGPDLGLGAQLCKRFAAEGLHVMVAGRTDTSVEAVAEDIRSNGGVATGIVADATSEDDVRALFDQAGDELDLAIYNAGNNTPGRIIDMEADYFENSWRVGCFGGFLFGREAVRRMVPKGTGTLLFTGASASLRGRARFGAFNSAKGALRNLAQAMAKEYGADGIHVGHVVIDGPIAGDKIIKAFPEYAEKLGPEGMISIEGIVDGFAYLYGQPRTAWTFEVDVRTSVEKW